MLNNNSSNADEEGMGIHNIDLGRSPKMTLFCWLRLMVSICLYFFPIPISSLERVSSKPMDNGNEHRCVISLHTISGLYFGFARWLFDPHTMHIKERDRRSLGC